MGAVGRPERVVHVDVGVGRERLRELRVVLLLLRVEAEVLEQQDLARPQPLDGVLGPDAERVAGDRHVPAEELASRRCATGRSRRLSWTLPSGRPRWLARIDPGALAEQGADGGHRGPDARVVGDLAVLERDVEVDAHEDALARGVDVADR